MSTVRTQQGGVLGHFEASLGTVLQRGCANCGTPHPLACRPIPLDTTRCVKCGAAVDPPSRMHVEPSTLTQSGPAMFIARCFAQAGAWLHSLGKRLDP